MFSINNKYNNWTHYGDIFENSNSNSKDKNKPSNSNSKDKLKYEDIVYGNNFLNHPHHHYRCCHTPVKCYIRPYGCGTYIY